MIWDVMLVVHRSGQIDFGNAHNNDGVLVANYNIAKQLQNNGKRVCLISASSTGVDCEYKAIPVIHVDDGSDETLAATITSAGGCDTLIENTKATVFRYPVASRHLVIMHNRHHLWGAETYGRSIYGLVQKAICVSEYSRRENLLWGLPEHLSTVIPNGCDVSCFYPRNVPREPKRIIFAGYCAPRKGIHHAIDAFIRVRENGHSDAELVICGKQSSWEPGPEHDAFTKRGWLDGSQCIAWDRVERECPGLKYLGVQSHDELALEFSRSSVLVLPSRMDTFGLVAVEAQACGCATILPLNGPFSGCIHESLFPLLYDARIENELERKLIEFFESPMSLEDSQIVSKQISARFSWENSGQQYVDLISSLPPLPRSARWKFQAAQFAKAILRKIRFPRTRNRMSVS